MTCGIYRIRYKNKSYYGSSKNVEKRFSRHKADLKSNRHHNKIIQRIYNKYSIKVLQFEILEICEEHELFCLEQKYIDSDTNNINIGSVGGGDNISNNPNKKQIIIKMKETLKQTISNMSEKERKNKYGRKLNHNGRWKGGKPKCQKCGKEIFYTNKTCRECHDKSGTNNPFYGKIHSEKTKLELSKKAKKRLNDENYVHPQSKKYVVIENNKEIVFNSISKIAKHFCVTNAAVSKVLKQGRPNKRGNMKNIVIKYLEY